VDAVALGTTLGVGSGATVELDTADGEVRHEAAKRRSATRGPRRIIAHTPVILATSAARSSLAFSMPSPRA
jgi:hypothetical protein